MAPQTTLIAHLAFSSCAFKTTCRVVISYTGIRIFICQVQLVELDTIYKLHTDYVKENVHWYQSILFAAFEVGFLFLPHKNLNMLWSQAPLTASENQINHYYVRIRVYG